MGGGVSMVPPPFSFFSPLCSSSSSPSRLLEKYIYYLPLCFVVSIGSESFFSDVSDWRDARAVYSFLGVPRTWPTPPPSFSDVPPRKTFPIAEDGHSQLYFPFSFFDWTCRKKLSPWEVSEPPS